MGTTKRYKKLTRTWHQPDNWISAVDPADVTPNRRRISVARPDIRLYQKQPYTQWVGDVKWLEPQELRDLSDN